MTKYVQESMLIDTQIDEIGRTKCLNRLNEEDILNFKDRVYLCNTITPKSTLNYYNFALNNHLNLFQKKVFRIFLNDSMINVNDLPRIEIKANSIEVWKEQSKESVLFLHFRDEKYKFLYQIKEALESLDFLTIETIDYEPYLYSKNLKQDSSDGHTASIFLKDSKLQVLDQKYIERYNTNNPLVSYIEKESKEDVSAPGEYYLDKLNGFLYTFDANKGFANISFQDFPFIMEYNPAHIFEMNDESIEKVLYNKQIDEEGKEVFTKLNSYGSNLINRILEDNRMYWDK